MLLYFKGLSLRAVREFLLHKGYEVSIEAIREWYHAVGKALQAIYTIATSGEKFREVGNLLGKRSWQGEGL